MELFPRKNYNYNPNSAGNEIINEIFGRRFIIDQSMYEYLIEFLLIFISPKTSDYMNGSFNFHLLDTEELEYYVQPHMGFRRFVFFDSSKSDGTVDQDKEAYNKIRELLKNSASEFDNPTDIVDAIQDLFKGYAVIVKKRNWCAKQILPICPELIFCDAMPNTKIRMKKFETTEWNESNLNPGIDKFFSFDKRNFLGRGGEIYYLHILQGLQGRPREKERLETLLKYILVEPCKKISQLANVIDKIWTNSNHFNLSDRFSKLKIEFIPKDAYKSVENYTIDELLNFLECSIQPVYRIELLARGVMFQIIRMLINATYHFLGQETKKIIIDMKSNNNVKKVAIMGYKSIQNDFMIALNKSANHQFPDSKKNGDGELVNKLNEAKKNSIDILRARGKEIQCIIPPTGGNERFTLSEVVTRFLVLALIKPGQKMTLDMFLNKLYEHFGLVIGPVEYSRYAKENPELDESLASSFIDNSNAFQEFLKNSGFLRELSDATSIVENPYAQINYGGELK